MADSLILKGVKDVCNQTGSDFLLRRPKGGGDQWQIKRWWVNGGVSTLYASCTVFDIAGMKLVIDTQRSSRVKLVYDGTDIKFFGVRDINHAALMTENFEVIEHYVMPKLAGGAVMIVTPADGADRPGTGEPEAPAPAPTGAARVSPAPAPGPSPAAAPAPAPAPEAAKADQQAQRSRRYKAKLKVGVEIEDTQKSK